MRHNATFEETEYSSIKKPRQKAGLPVGIVWLLSFQGVSTSDDLKDLIGNAGLAGFIVFEFEITL